MDNDRNACAIDDSNDKENFQSQCFLNKKSLKKRLCATPQKPNLRYPIWKKECISNKDESVLRFANHSRPRIAEGWRHFVWDHLEKLYLLNREFNRIIERLEHSIFGKKK
ncbi:hypothetical protein BB560_001797 [Smittium megazygosporum]|uniref:Uncharacterized protein n=1 Tax=Smittium megazygosporum TaxID=133381 RepID=A0A2T9ZGK1_9FUNG|nr:hypothetical protein BB560_001797 [Smittium megazygosporum]